MSSPVSSPNNKPTYLVPVSSGSNTPSPKSVEKASTVSSYILNGPGPVPVLSDTALSMKSTGSSPEIDASAQPMDDSVAEEAEALVAKYGEDDPVPFNPNVPPVIKPDLLTPAEAHAASYADAQALADKAQASSKAPSPQVPDQKAATVASQHFAIQRAVSDASPARTFVPDAAAQSIAASVAKDMDIMHANENPPTLSRYLLINDYFSPVEMEKMKKSEKKYNKPLNQVLVECASPKKDTQRKLTETEQMLSDYMNCGGPSERSYLVSKWDQKFVEWIDADIRVAAIKNNPAAFIKLFATKYNIDDSVIAELSNRKNGIGQTPLHSIAMAGNEEGNVEYAEYLIGLGSDMNSEDSMGKSPFDYALHFAVVEHYDDLDLDRTVEDVFVDAIDERNQRARASAASAIVMQPPTS